MQKIKKILRNACTLLNCRYICGKFYDTPQFRARREIKASENTR